MQEQKRVWQKLRAMITYASTHACRRRQLLSYFGEEYSPENCGTCDVCTGDKKLVDASRDAQMIMSAMVRTGQRFGAGHVIEVVCGAQTERIRRFRHDSLPTYGVGKGKSRKHWRSVIDHLIAHQFLAKTDDQYPVLRLTGEGAELLRGRRTFEMPAVIEEKVTRRVVTVQADEDPGLFQRLREVRLSLARRQGVPPYVVFSDATLHDMCRRLPTCEAEMLGVNGVGQKKLDRYGAAFIAAIAAHAGGEERG
jgi:ATP-dependent DNA helicase RecQ